MFGVMAPVVGDGHTPLLNRPDYLAQKQNSGGPTIESTVTQLVGAALITAQTLKADETTGK